ncbi:ATP-binding protein [Erwinia sp. E_sp_B04_7]|uniref:ATP-binding protein n=1 Tax=unclassified Erwinia TaxID=2622719 RepID=UPI0030D1229C
MSTGRVPDYLQQASRQSSAAIKLSIITSRTPRFDLEQDVSLSSQIRQQLSEALVKIKHYHTIYQIWGFSAVDPVGKGVILNFYGPPGTGKTLTAEALAGSLQMKILMVSIADLESKFMGETAKNIVALFQQAESEGALLFFDEADTLLGKRLSSVTQGIDNEVNAMRSTLLIELENYQGVAIFATNFVKNYDTAFLSRITQHIHFELPGEVERLSIWSRMIVPGIPLAVTREHLLDQLVQSSAGLSGRDIRNCMRLALPKAVQMPDKPQLTPEHLQQAIVQVRQAWAAVQSSPPQQTSSPTEMARKMLGVS